METLSLEDKLEILANKALKEINSLRNERYQFIKIGIVSDSNLFVYKSLTFVYPGC